MEAKPKVGRPAVYTPAQLIDRLVQATSDLLAEQGADADLSVAQIAARAKVSKRTVYTAISSKEALLALVIRRDVETVTAMLDDPVASPGQAVAVLARFLTLWAGLACGPSAVGILVLAIRERSRYPAIGAAYHSARMAHGFDKLASWLQRMDRKKFLTIADPGLTAEFVLTMVASERQRKLALGIAAPLADAELTQRVNAILRLVIPNDLP
ncbi:TetR/AcrR family transcriptional regulator [Massilia sp. S19_KUP03_FR1]|uniref:TetR/AcrR family transcriptional regulator n=1 Tax=Massilia sp. S19_KUP03_FR1 TaxID=3025503 RepID=UPI002FCD7234